MLDSDLARLMSLDGLVALVTGGRGIGRGIAELLARAGARVAVADRVIDDELRGWIGKIPGGALFNVDVRDAASVDRLVDEVEEHFGGVNILVNNAAIYPLASLADLTVEQWDATLDTNLRGAFLLLRRVAAGMRAHGKGGRIVNISSINTRRTYVGVAHYDASKAGLEALTKAAALELAADDITCNAVAPGGVLTPGSLPLRTAKGFPATEAEVEVAGRALPLGRACEPADVAAAVWFLASPAAAYVTGQILYVDGGATIGPSPRA
jgi:NAD(P)-dependent dehydrogenase (short-subunit alcohol dehydrogenase family)